MGAITWQRHAIRFIGCLTSVNQAHGHESPMQCGLYRTHHTWSYKRGNACARQDS